MATVLRWILVAVSLHAIVRPVAAPAAGPGPPEVGITTVRPSDTELPLEYAGRVAGFHDVQVRPQVDGLLLRRAFDEGAPVAQDQLLFEIDPAAYKVALNRAQAELLRNQATLRQAEDEYGRTEDLFQRGVSATKQRGVALAARDQARAGVQSAQADVDAAALDLSHTKITAPAAGITALQSPSTGTLVQARQTVLTTITQTDPAYVNFSVADEEDQEIRALNEKRAKPLTNADLSVELQYGNGRGYKATGKIDMAAQRVDPQTGTIQIRAVFPNPDNTLLPGQFVRIRIRGLTIPDAIVVPFQAVTQGPQGPAVYVVNKSDEAEARPIKLGQEVAHGWIVESGLSDGDRVVVDGVIRVTPGSPVKPVPIASGS